MSSPTSRDIIKLFYSCDKLLNKLFGEDQQTYQNIKNALDMYFKNNIYYILDLYNQLKIKYPSDISTDYNCMFIIHMILMISDLDFYHIPNPNLIIKNYIDNLCVIKKGNNFIIYPNIFNFNKQCGYLYHVFQLSVILESQHYYIYINKKYTKVNNISFKNEDNSSINNEDVNKNKNNDNYDYKFGLNDLKQIKEIKPFYPKNFIPPNTSETNSPSNSNSNSNTNPYVLSRNLDYDIIQAHKNNLVCVSKFEYNQMKNRLKYLTDMLLNYEEKEKIEEKKHKEHIHLNRYYDQTVSNYEYTIKEYDRTIAKLMEKIKELECDNTKLLERYL